MTGRGEIAQILGTTAQTSLLDVFLFIYLYKMYTNFHYNFYLLTGHKFRSPSSREWSPMSPTLGHVLFGKPHGLHTPCNAIIQVSVQRIMYPSTTKSNFTSFSKI